MGRPSQEGFCRPRGIWDGALNLNLAQVTRHPDFAFLCFLPTRRLEKKGPNPQINRASHSIGACQRR
jgi:hypothetical protein